MPTVLGPEYDNSFAARPRRMSTQDWSIWQRWWERHRAETLRLWFDVGLGAGQPAGGETRPEFVAMWLTNTQKRADAVRELADRVEIVEFRDSAEPNAIGRLQVYDQLWRDDPASSKRVTLRLVTNRDDADTRRLAERLGIIYEVV